MFLRKLSRVVLTVAVAVVLALPVSSASEEARKIKVVLVPERNIFNQQSKYMIMRDYISSILPVNIEFNVLKDYEEVMEVLEIGEADRRGEG